MPGPLPPPDPRRVLLGGLRPDGAEAASPWPYRRFGALALGGGGGPLPAWLGTEAEPVAAAELPELGQQQAQVHAGLSANQQTWGPRAGLRAEVLAEVGWGLVLPPAGVLPQEDALLDALEPLLERRAAQCGPLYQGPRRRAGRWEVPLRLGAGGARAWRAGFGQGDGTIDPEKLAYYLLLLGEPEHIPLMAQRVLGAQYAVGRLPLLSTSALRRYAEQVLRAEDGALPRARELGFFAPDPDPFTALSRVELVEPLAQTAAARTGWATALRAGGDAGRAALQDLLGAGGPAVVFSATHGLCLRAGAPEQRALQGALVCQDWPGPGDPVLPEHRLSGAELLAGPPPAGAVAFFFACFSAATPPLDEVGRRLLQGAGLAPQARLAPAPFLAELPRAMLSHPDGPALAVVGHVDRTTSASFVWAEDDQSPLVHERTPYEDLLWNLCQGQPLGAALDPIARWSAEKHRRLSELLVELNGPQPPGPGLLSAVLSATVDADGFVLLGDPAVQLCGAAASQREATPQPDAELALLERWVLSALGGKPSPVALYRQAGRRTARARGLDEAQIKALEQALAQGAPPEVPEAAAAYRAEAQGALARWLGRQGS